MVFIFNKTQSLTLTTLKNKAFYRFQQYSIQKMITMLILDISQLIFLCFSKADF